MSDERPPEKRPTSSTPPQGNPKPQGMQSLVQSIVDQQKESKAELNAAMARPQKRAKLGMPALAVLIVANVIGWVVVPPTKDKSGDIRSPIEIERDLRVLIASAAGQIEMWKLQHGNALPPNLAAVGVKDTLIGYALVDSTTYVIRGTSKGISSTYRSNVRVQDFLEATPGIKR
jgi:hypothetical protein